MERIRTNKWNFSVVVRINWEYTIFDGGTNIIDCSTTVPLSSQGSGSWSVYSGNNGSFAELMILQQIFLVVLGLTCCYGVVFQIA